MVYTTKTGYPVARSLALATMWFIPKVLLVESQIFRASAKVLALIMMYLSLNVHWKPN
jgi:hypothetical protein